MPAAISDDGSECDLLSLSLHDLFQHREVERVAVQNLS